MPDQTELGTFITDNYRFGQKPSSVTSFNVVWPVVGKAGPDYRNINSGDYVQLASTNAADTASGTGMRSVWIEGCLADGLTAQRELVWLNGTTPVTTAYQYARVFRAWGQNCGTSGTNVGSLFCGYGTFTSGVPANIEWQISADAGQTQQVTGMLPSSQTAHIHNIHWGTGRTGGGQDVLATFQLRARRIYNVSSGKGNYELGPWRQRMITSTIADINFDTDVNAFVLEGPSDVEVRAFTSAAGTRVHASVSYQIYRRIKRD